MIINAKVEGLDRALGNLEKLAEALPEAAEEGVNQVAQLICDVAKELVPVDAGALQKSIRVQRRSEAEKFTAIVAAGGVAVNPKTGRLVDYAHFVEHGSSQMAPRPYLKPAQMIATREAPEIMFNTLARRWKG